MIPTIVGRELAEGLAQHLKAQFPVSTPFFDGVWDRFFDPERGARVLKGPWLSLPLPFRKDESEAARTRFAPALSRLAFPPYAHQVKAWDRVERFLPTLVATGTGSGKTECFTYPVLRHCAAFKDEPGIRAIFVYPMNALASDQALRLAKLVAGNPGLAGVRVGLYIGENDKKRRKGAPKPKPRSKEMTADSVVTDLETIVQSPPHILLTNYKMLDYMLVRPKEAPLWAGNKPGVLRFLAVDELHTFDGAQAADLACLVRRLKERLGIEDDDPAQRLCCIGTSATLGSGAESVRRVVSFASKVFDAVFDEDSLVGEDRLSPDEVLPPPSGIAVPAFGPDGALALPKPGETPEDYLGRQRALWEIEAPEDILRRPFVQEAIRALASGPLAIRVLAARLAETARAADWTDPPLRAEAAEAALRSACALLSDLRSKKGRGHPEVRLQLWARELARMAASLEAEPRLVFSDDLQDPNRLRDDAEGGAMRHYLPLVNCRECGCTGYLAMHNRQDHTLDGTRLQIYKAHLGRGSDDLSMLVPLRDGDSAPALLSGTIRRVCPHCKAVLSDKEERCPNCGARDLLRVAEEPSHPVGQGRNPRHEITCPSCGGGADGLLLFGMRSATLLSHFIQVLTASRFNADRKLIAFSDNVQDSSHRAGFIGGRTWSGTFRAHLSQFLASWLPKRGGSAETPVPLHEAATAFEAWLGATYPDGRNLFGMLLPQDLKDLPAWHALQEKPEEPLPSAAAVDALLYRLHWEMVQEFGLRSNIGRTLPRLGIAKAVPILPAEDDPVWARLAAGLSSRTEALRVFEGSPGLLRAAVEALAGQMIAMGAFDDDRDVVRKVADWGTLYALHVRRRVKQKAPYNFDLLRPQGERQLHLAFPARRLKEGGSSKLAALVARTDPSSRIAKAVAAVGAPLDETSLDEVFDALVGEGLMENVEDESRHVAFRLLPKERVGIRLLENAPSCSPLFRALFLEGALHRVNAAEHTGLLDRDEREALEKKFKANPSKTWYPNLVSATPTLEMGVDIGDLSTVLLCSVPPTQAKYLQRIGRSGRANGSALDVAVASAKPHDLYFFADPEEMLRGEVSSPGVFLDASEILRRQYFAFALGEWLLSPGNPGLPADVDAMLRPWALAPGDPGRAAVFPAAFERWYSAEVASGLLDRFLDRLKGIHRTTFHALEDFALPDPARKDTLRDAIREEVSSMFTALKGYQGRCRSLRDRIRDMKKDATLSEDKRKEKVAKLEREKRAWEKLVLDRKKQPVLEWLCDTAGLLPNYAFPEPGIELQALLWRKEEDDEEQPVFDRIEVARPASSGLTELVPGSTFFTHGHRCLIDQVDLAATGIDAQNPGERWRFCPECDYMERAGDAAPQGPCPVCGGDWRDNGQVRTLLRARQFITVKKARDAIVDDATDQRKPLFHDCKKFFLRKSDDDLSFAGGDEEHPFGFEFIQHLDLVEVNFGRPASGRDQDGEVSVNGRRIFGGSFYVCPECGKAVDSEPGVRSRRFHLPTCSHSRNEGDEPREEDEDNVAQEQEGEIKADFYRTYSTEALRIFAPFLGEEDDERISSFVSALQLGLQKKFGGEVNHLQMQLESMPAGPNGARRNFVILYDSIPGGSGYLRQFVKEDGQSADLIFEVMQLALDAIRNCSCAADPSKDGCYRCLFRYRNQRDQKTISRRAAISVLEELLKARGTLKKTTAKNFIGGGIRLAALLESELERRFVARLKQVVDKIPGGRFEYGCVRGTQEGIRLMLPEKEAEGDSANTWEIVLQQDLGPANGVLAECRPDAVFYPVGKTESSCKPVAVFLDGWEYHRERVGDDLRKRMAIAKSGRYRVWSLAWQDVVPPAKPAEAPPWRKRLISDEMDNVRRSVLEKIMGASESNVNEAKSWGTSFNKPDSEMDRLVFYLRDANDDRFLRDTRADALAFYAESKQSGRTVSAPIAVPAGWSDIQPAGDLFDLGLGGASTRLGFGAGSAPLLAACFEDRIPEKIVEADWHSFFSFVNFFQGLDGFLAFSATTLGDSLWQTLRLGAGAAGAGAWGEAFECAEGDDSLESILHDLQSAGVDPPEVFSDLAGKDGEIVGNAILCWPDRRVAVVGENVVLDGWTILVAPAGKDNGFIQSIKTALTAS